jgi:hypothetical protein
LASRTSHSRSTFQYFRRSHGRASTRRNRLDVAISRAQCVAVLVRSPRLLETRCHSIEEMALVNALCGLVEDAEGSRG